MGNKSEDISPVLKRAREEYAKQQKKNPNSVANFRASLIYDNARKAFDRMFNVDGTFTEEGKKDWERFLKFKLKLDSSVTYYVRGLTQLDLYKFLCFYIMKERTLRVVNATRKAEREGKDTKGISDNIFSLIPVVVFASSFADYKTSDKKDDDNMLGDSKGRILVFYIPDTPLYGDQSLFYSSAIKDYAHTKNLVNEHVIILSEKNMAEFSSGSSFPVIDLTTGVMKSSQKSSIPTENNLSSNVKDEYNEYRESSR